jgi:rRNA maturation endonuclease Nob1
MGVPDDRLLQEISRQVARLAFAVEQLARPNLKNFKVCNACLSTIVPTQAQKCPACGETLPSEKGENHDNGG